MRLSDVRDGESVQIAHVNTDADARAWLSAVGLSEGETVIVLRRALFRGPLHVRTEAGAELAVGHALGCDIEVLRHG